MFWYPKHGYMYYCMYSCIELKLHTYNCRNPSQLSLGLDSLVLMATSVKVLLDLGFGHVHNRRVLDGARHRNVLFKVTVHRILDQLAQHAPQRLAGPRLGDHALALDDAAQRRNGADLLAHRLLQLLGQLVVGNGRGRVVGCGERDEGKGELALEGVWDADDAALCHEWVGGDGLLDSACVGS